MPPITLDDVVSKLQSTVGSSAAHRPTNFFSLSKIRGLRPSWIRLFVRSTYPLNFGCATTVQSTQMLKSSQNYRNGSPVN